jgi:hypothetical protein
MWHTGLLFPPCVCCLLWRPCIALQAADRIEADHLVFELKPSSPRLRAQQQQHAATAELNRQLAQQIPQLSDWQQLQEFLQQHSSVLNFLAVTAVASQAAVVHKVGSSALLPMQA